MQKGQSKPKALYKTGKLGRAVCKDYYFHSRAGWLGKDRERRILPHYSLILKSAMITVSQSKGFKHFQASKTEFLNFGTISILGWIDPCCDGLSCVL